MVNCLMSIVQHVCEKNFSPIYVQCVSFMQQCVFIILATMCVYYVCKQELYLV